MGLMRLAVDYGDAPNLPDLGEGETDEQPGIEPVGFPALGVCRAQPQMHGIDTLMDNTIYAMSVRRYCGEMQ